MNPEMRPVTSDIAHCREDRERLQGQVDLMESGTLQFRSRSTATDWVDTTPDLIESYKNQITQLDDLIARYSETG